MKRFLFHFALIVLALLTLAPFVWMLAASFMPTGEASAIPPRLWPSAPTLDHYRDLFTRMDMGRYAFNSALIALLATVLATMINAMAGYAFAKLHFAGREALFRSLLAAMVIPAQVAMLPLFLMLKHMGLINTYAGVLVPLLA
ncbi:MAG: carbohydrate ABC transporter permease, partial [Halothiobacillaceae bacterium]|nr:carbohydrate ABC transporter permease [Halothiobacillaceae bacterium]